MPKENTSQMMYIINKGDHTMKKQLMFFKKMLNTLQHILNRIYIPIV